MAARQGGDLGTMRGGGGGGGAPRPGRAGPGLQKSVEGDLTLS